MRVFFHTSSHSLQSRRTDCTKAGHQQEDTAEREKQEQEKTDPQRRADCTEGAGAETSKRNGQTQGQAKSTRLRSHENETAKIGIAECGASASKSAKTA